MSLESLGINLRIKLVLATSWIIENVAKLLGYPNNSQGMPIGTNPNTVYRAATKENGGKGGTKVGINLVAISDIKAGDELFDDYRRHGSAPHWLLDFAKKYDVTLNFAECNDFGGSER